MKYHSRFLLALAPLFLGGTSAFAQVHLTLDANTAIRSTALTPANANTIVDGLNANATHKFGAGVLPVFDAPGAAAAAQAASLQKSSNLADLASPPAALANLGLTPSLLGIGDSLIGDNIGGQTGVMQILAATYPFAAGRTYHNGAMPGHDIADIIAAYPASGHPYTPAVTGDALCYAYVLAGINDCATTDTAATIYARLLTLWGLVRADGCKLIASTIPLNSLATPYNHATIAALNSLILGDPTKYDAVIDAQSILGPNYATGADGYFVHPLTAGHYAIAQAILASFKYPTFASGGYYNSLFVGSNQLSDNSGVLTISGALNWDGGRAHTDGGGGLYVGAIVCTYPSTFTTIHVSGDQSTGGDVYGTRLFASGGLYATTASSLDNGNITTNGGGGLSLGQINASGTGSTFASLHVSGDQSTAGNVYANSYYGSAAPLTALNASALASGTVPSARLALASSDLAAAGVERLISSTVLSSAQASLTITVPSGFHHLRLLSAARSTFGSQLPLYAQVDGDSTAADYANEILCAWNNGYASGATNPGTGVAVPGLNVLQVNGTDAPSLASSETIIDLGAKTAVMHGSSFINGYLAVIANTATWNGSAAVTSLTLSPAAGANITSGSSFYLYGY